MKICEYGCGKEAKYCFSTANKWCCSKHYNQCPAKRREHSIRMEEVWEDLDSGLNSTLRGEKISKILREAHKDLNSGYNSDLYREKKSKTQKEAWEDPNSGLNSDSCRKKMSESHKNKKCSKETVKKISEANKGSKNGMFGRSHSEETRNKQRISTIKNIENRYGQCFPNYNPLACKLIDEYGKTHGYNFQHAENGGEFFIKELGYWVDGYDQNKNIVIEVDESFHFDHNGDLKERDAQRQKEIEKCLNCEFIRRKI